MRATLFLLKRCLFPEKGNLLALALWISVAGVALGIIQLMLVLAVMSGFQDLFRKSYTRITGEIVVMPRSSLEGAPDFRLGLQGTRGVEAATPFSFGAGMLMRKGGVGGVVLEGIDVDSSRKVTPWEEVWVSPPDLDAQSKTDKWMWLGKQLADQLKVGVGDEVSVLIADGEAKKIVPFKVTALTKFGIYTHDLRYAGIDLTTLNTLFKKTHQEPMYKIKVDPRVPIEDAAETLKEKWGRIAQIKQWSDINQNIFLAVQHQKFLLFLVLEIVVALAAMNVVNLLMMSSHQRKRDMAILQAMGLRVRHAVLFFVAQGAAVGFVGIVLGIGMGYVVCRVVERFQPALLAEAQYNVTRLPIRIELLDVSLVAAIAFLLCVIFSLLPALKAAFSRPVDALRYE